MDDNEFNEVLFGDATEWSKGEFYFLPTALKAKRQSEKLRYKREEPDNVLSPLVARTVPWFAFAYEGHVDLATEPFDDDPVEVIPKAPVRTFHFSDFPRKAMQLLDMISEAARNGDILLVTVTEENDRKFIDVEVAFSATESKAFTYNPI